MNSLFSRNFDQESEMRSSYSGKREAQVAAPTSIPIKEVEAMIEAARAESYDQGRLDGAEDALEKERSTRNAFEREALQSLAFNMAELVRKDARIRGELELEVAELLFGIGERILPDLFDHGIQDLLVARVYFAARMITGKGEVNIRLSEEVAEALTPRIETLLGSLGDKAVAFKICGDPSIDEGTVRLDWQNGFLDFDPSYACQDVLEALKEAVFELRSQLENSR